MSTTTVLQSLLRRLRQAASNCARIRANLEGLFSRGPGFSTAGGRRIRLWFEILARRMLHRSSAALRTNVQTGDIFVGAAMRLMRALRHVSPLDPQAFFGLVGLQIRRELIDVARRCKHFAPTSPEPAGTEPAAADDPRQLESWTRFHEAIDRLAPDLKVVVELH